MLLLIASVSWSIGLLDSQETTSNLTDPYIFNWSAIFCRYFYFIYFAFKFPVSDIVPHQMPTILSVFSLGVLGDAIAFTISFIWLLNNVTPVLVSTYAYVNPVVLSYHLGFSLEKNLNR